MSIVLTKGLTPSDVYGVSPVMRPRDKTASSTGETQDPSRTVGATQDREPRVAFDRRTHKRCVKCRKIKPMEEFGQHEDNHDGKQTYCYECKNALGKRRREMNVRARLRHHISTRVAAQLGDLTPPNLTRDLTDFLSYTMGSLVEGLRQRLAEDYPHEKLRDVLNRGWHVDHIHPLSRFKVVVTEPGRSGSHVDWAAFRECWAISNLRAIPAEDNLAKGAKVASSDPFNLKTSDSQ